MKTNKTINPAQLKSLSPLEELPSEAALLLAARTYFETLTPGEELFVLGTESSWSLYLLSGEVELLCEEGSSSLLVGGSEQAKRPLGYQKPYRFSAKAKTPVIFVQIKDEMIEEFLPYREELFAAEPCYPQNLVTDERVERRLLQDLRSDLKANKLMVPSLPDVANKVRDAAGRPSCTVDELAALIHADPALAARLVQVSNSPIYRTQSPITTCPVAISRIGLKATQNLVTSFSLQQLFNTQAPLLKEKMAEVWQRATYVAAITVVLARMASRLDEDRALLAGLVHNIGALPVLAYAERFPRMANNRLLLERLIEQLSAKLGEAILRKWQFDTDFTLVPKECKNWLRNSGPTVDYAEIVALAQIYSYIDTPQMALLPKMEEIPAYHKLPLGRLGPRMTLKVLEEAKADMEAIQKMLRGR